KRQLISLFRTLQPFDFSSTSTMSQTPKLPQATVDILELHLPEFRDAQTKRRKEIVADTSDQTVAPGSSKAHAKRHKKVSEFQTAKFHCQHDVTLFQDGERVVLQPWEEK